MKNKELLNIIEELLEINKDSLKGPEILSELPSWDSLAVVGFIALMDKHFSIEVHAPDVATAKTINDLITLAGNRIEK